MMSPAVRVDRVDRRVYSIRGSKSGAASNPAKAVWKTRSFAVFIIDLFWLCVKAYPHQNTPAYAAQRTSARNMIASKTPGDMRDINPELCVPGNKFREFWLANNHGVHGTAYSNVRCPAP